VRALQVIRTVGFLKKLSTIDGVAKYRDIASTRGKSLIALSLVDIDIR